MQALIIFSLLTCTHMSLVKAKHTLLYTEANESLGYIKENVTLLHLKEGQDRAECNGL